MYCTHYNGKTKTVSALLTDAHKVKGTPTWGPWNVCGCEVFVYRMSCAPPPPPPLPLLHKIHMGPTCWSASHSKPHRKILLYTYTHPLLLCFYAGDVIELIKSVYTKLDTLPPNLYKPYLHFSQHVYQASIRCLFLAIG